jgi:hypothetical protein
VGPSINDIVWDDADNLFVCGSGPQGGSCAFGSTWLYGGRDYSKILTARLSRSGNWDIVQQSDIQGTVRTAVINHSGSIYLTGICSNESNFGSTYISRGGAFIAQADSLGNWIWAKRAISFSQSSQSSGIELFDLALNSQNNIVATGRISGCPYFDPIGQIISGTGVFAGCFSSDGEWQWVNAAVSENTSYGSSGIRIVIDNNDNTFLSGYTFCSIAFPAIDSTCIISNLGWSRVQFISKLDNQGHWLWAKQVTNNGYPNPGEDCGIFIDQSDNCVVSGPFTYDLVLGNFTLDCSCVQSIFIASITDIPFACIESNQVSVFDFPLCYLGDVSVPHPVVLSSTGIDTLRISSMCWDSDDGNYNLDLSHFNSMLPPGASDTLYVVFTPQVSGIISDTLFISSNAENTPILHIPFRGQCQYVPPETPEDMIINIEGNNAVISWSPVTETIYGTAIIPDGYVIEYSERSDGPFYFLGFTDEAVTEYTHLNVIPYGNHGQSASSMFYRVYAIVNLRDDLRIRLRDYHPDAPTSWTKVQRKLESMQR